MPLLFRGMGILPMIFTGKPPLFRGMGILPMIFTGGTPVPRRRGTTAAMAGTQAKTLAPACVHGLQCAA